MSAEHHWIALDRAFGQVLSPAQSAQARSRFSRRAAALSRIYVPRLAHIARHAADGRREERRQGVPGDRDLTREVLELEDAHRALTAALAAAREAVDQGPRTNGRTKDPGRTKDQAPGTKD